MDTSNRPPLTPGDRGDGADEVRFGSDDTGKRRALGHRRPRRLLLAVAATVVAAALAVSLVLLATRPPGRAAASPAPTASDSPANVRQNPSAVPQYYVSLVRSPTPSLVVRDTDTGKTVVTIAPPADLTFGAVYGTATGDRTFVVTGDRLHGIAAGPTWYLLRITPGADSPVQLTTLSIRGAQLPTGVALSPDGTELAVARPGSPATLQVFSVNTGTLLRRWSTTAPGELAAEKGTAGVWAATAAVLRWSPDGRQLAFTWNDAEIRVLNAGGPGGDLIAESKTVAAIGTTSAARADFVCNAAQGWQLVQGGEGVVCAGGGLDHLAWANPDGSVLIGSQAWVGHERSGIFRGDKFTALPAQAASPPVPAGVLDGTVAW